jgi:Lon protease-like protein
MINDAMSSDRLIGMIQPEPDFEKGRPAAAAEVGCAAASQPARRPTTASW